MYCMNCGVALPAEVNFCYNCGKPQEKVAIAQEKCQVAETCADPKRICEIFYKTTGEKWGIFPRDIGEFQARIVNADEAHNSDSERVIKASAKIELLSVENLPNAKDKKHQKALDSLARELLNAGWNKLDEQGAEWFSLRFEKTKQ